MAGYTVERSILVDAPAKVVHALVDDFRRWTQWSPWEGVDPALERDYSGPDQGLGAQYAWSGNRKAGQGRMEITGSTPEAVDVDIDFLKPFRSSAHTRFGFVPTGAATEVTWHMTGEQKGLMGVFGKFLSMDRLLGPEFEKGLSRLKTAAEQRH